VEEGDGSLARYAGVGIQFAAAIILFLFAGQWLDRRLGTSPVFLILGVFVGAGAAFYSMYRKLMEDQDAEEARKKGERPGKGEGR
jgi:F0F1-type ATP synthase assembly protein I